MKHKISVTFVLLLMFLVAQIIGLFVIRSYSGKTLPYGMQPPEMKPEITISSILIAIFLAVSFVLILMKIKANWILRIWFFSVVAIALAITFNAFFQGFVPSSHVFALALGVILSFIKVFKRDILVHNLTELFIYPGIAAILVPLLGIWSISLLLLSISLYDIYAVWHAGFMQEMAKYQIKELKFFAGFFVPYLPKSIAKSAKPSKSKKFQKIRVNLALLGGGDVIFPILAAGVFLNLFGIIPALIVSFFATIGLLYLFVMAEKGKFYPAMPFIAAGCFVGFLAVYLLKLASLF